MQIEVEFWGVTARLAGHARQTLTLGAGATVADAITALRANPDLNRELPRCAFAIGDDMVTAQQSLRDGDALSILPPVSGG